MRTYDTVVTNLAIGGFLLNAMTSFLQRPTVEIVIFPQLNLSGT